VGALALSNPFNFSRKLGIFHLAGKWGRVGSKLVRHVQASRIRRHIEQKHDAESAEAVSAGRSYDPILERAKKQKTETAVHEQLLTASPPFANNYMCHMQYAWWFQNALTWYMMFERARTFARWSVSTIGEILVLRLSRKREFRADATAAALLGSEPTIEALRRLHGNHIKPPAAGLAYAKLMIRSPPREWFSTHPPIEARIEALVSGEFHATAAAFGNLSADAIVASS
jgi:hypothetical protein